MKNLKKKMYQALHSIYKRTSHGEKGQGGRTTPLSPLNSLNKSPQKLYLQKRK